MLSSVSNKGSGIKVTWKKVTGAASYYVYRRTNNGAWKRRAVLSASSNSYIDRNVKQGKKYTYKVPGPIIMEYSEGSVLKKRYID